MDPDGFIEKIERFDLCRKFMLSVFGIKFYDLGLDLEENSEHLILARTIVSQFRGFTLYDDEGNSVSEKTVKPDNCQSSVSRIVMQFETFNVEYVRAKSEDSGKFKASGFQYKTDDYDNFDKALEERIEAAYVLVYKAKKAGWENINFGDTSDPVERCILMYVCDSVGLSCAKDEEVTFSNRVHVQDWPGDNHPAAQKFNQEHSKQDDDTSEEDNLERLITFRINEYCKRCCEKVQNLDLQGGESSQEMELAPAA